jgi:hypothetical protein
MRLPEQNNAKPVDQRWHDFREMARRESFDASEWTDQERRRYDLDDDSDYPGEITGEDNPESWTIGGEEYGVRADRHDIGENPNIGMPDSEKLRRGRDR